MPAGRPKKTVKATLSKGWHDTVLALYSEGASDVEIRTELDISQDLFDRWIEEEEEFSLTIKRGRELCQAWWQREGRTSLRDKEFSYTGWYMQMKNRFGWRDKTENENKDDVTLTIKREVKVKDERPT